MNLQQDWFKTVRILAVLTMLFVGSGCIESPTGLQERVDSLTIQNNQLRTKNDTLTTELEKLSEEINALRSELTESSEKNVAQLMRVQRLLGQNNVEDAEKLIGSIIENSPVPDSQIEIIASMIATVTAIVLLVLGFLGMVVFVIFTVWIGGSVVERFIRTIALMISFLVYFGATQTGLSIPQLLVSTLALQNPIVYAWIAAFVSSLAGIAVTVFIIRRLRSQSIIAYRLTIFISVLIISLFLDLFVTAFAAGADPIVLSANLFFVVGIGVYLVFRYEGTDLTSDQE